MPTEALIVGNASLLKPEEIGFDVEVLDVRHLDKQKIWEQARAQILKRFYRGDPDHITDSTTELTVDDGPSTGINSLRFPVTDSSILSDIAKFDGKTLTITLKWGKRQPETPASSASSEEIVGLAPPVELDHDSFWPSFGILRPGRILSWFQTRE